MTHRDDVYFVADSSFHGWTHEHADGKVWDHPQDAARSFICFCDERDAALKSTELPRPKRHMSELRGLFSGLPKPDPFF